jgi:hypothetical protein
MQGAIRATSIKIGQARSGGTGTSNELSNSISARCCETAADKAAVGLQLDLTLTAAHTKINSSG